MYIYVHFTVCLMSAFLLSDFPSSMWSLQVHHFMTFNLFKSSTYNDLATMTTCLQLPFYTLLFTTVLYNFITVKHYTNGPTSKLSFVNVVPSATRFLVLPPILPHFPCVGFLHLSILLV